MAVIHMELVMFLAISSILNAANKILPFADTYLSGIWAYAAASVANKTKVGEFVGKRGTMNLEEATEEAEEIVTSHRAPLRSRTLPLATLRGATNFHVMLFSLLVTVGVGSLSGVWSCLRGTVQHEMTFVALAVCALMVLSILIVRTLFGGAGDDETSNPQTMVRNMAIVFGLFSIIASLLSMMVPEHILDFSLQRGLRDAAGRTETFIALVLKDSNPDQAREPWVAFTLVVLSIVCGAMAFAQVMPALLYSRSLASSLRDPETGSVKRAILLAGFVAPLVVSALWVRPLLGSGVLPQDLVKCDADSLARDCVSTPHTGEFYLTETQWLSVRVGGAILVCLLHVPVIRWLAAAHMRRAREEQVSTLVEYVSVPESSINKEFDLDRELRLRAAEPFQTVNVVTSSMLGPFIVLFMLALAIIRKGELATLYTCPHIHHGLEAMGFNATALAVPLSEANKLSELDQILQNALATAFPEISRARNISLVSPLLWRPVLSLLIWFSLVSWFVLTALSMAYWQMMHMSSKMRIKDQADTPKAADAAAPAATKRPKRSAKSKGKQTKQE
jgi:hypothetical protein